MHFGHGDHDVSATYLKLTFLSETLCNHFRISFVLYVLEI